MLHREGNGKVGMWWLFWRLFNYNGAKSSSAIQAHHLHATALGLWVGGGVNFTPLLVWTGCVSVRVGTNGRATRAGFSECTRAQTRSGAQECVHKEQLMPREWSVRLMDGSYTAVMTCFDVARQSRPNFRHGSKSRLKSVMLPFLKNLFMSRCENKEMASLPLSSPERHNLDLFFPFFTFSNLLFKARSMQKEICPSAERQTEPPLADT